MLRVGFVTLFPEMIHQAVGHSILRRAVEAGLVAFETQDPRDFTADKHRTVDDSPFGGGPGMVMKAEPVAQAIEALGDMEAVVFTDPTGTPFTQQVARELAGKGSVGLVCGHYEGIDDRARERFATHTLSLGDFVLTNGELPALVIADAIVRLLPGALGSGESLDIDSFGDGLLSAPQYTRPEVWREAPVPPVLLSGNHGEVKKWKRRMALKTTRARRPDLFATARLTEEDLKLLAR